MKAKETLKYAAGQLGTLMRGGALVPIGRGLPAFPLGVAARPVFRAGAVTLAVDPDEITGQVKPCFGHAGVRLLKIT